MQAVAKDLQVMIGVSFLESDGKDFFVTFVLLGRDGQELGRIRKRKAAAQEAYYVASDTDRSHVLTVTDSKLGTLKIGVGICYENYHIQLPCHFQQEGVDLVLQPHSANIMNLNGAPLAKLYATTLGVPVVMVNKYNPKMGFPGNSAIAYFTEEGELKVEPPDKQTQPFIKTFSLKKQASHPLNCDSSVIGTEPQLWPEALIQFQQPPLDITQRFETFDLLQKKIEQLEGQLREASDRLLKLKSLVDTQPSSWPEVHDPFSETPQRLETPEALQKTIAELEVQTETVLKEIEKLNLLKVSVGRIKGFFDEVETDGKNFYNEEYVKERKEWALDIVQEYANCLKRRIESSSKEKS